MTATQANPVEQVKTLIDRMEDQLDQVDGALTAHPNRLSSELLILKQLAYSAVGTLHPDGRHSKQETINDIDSLTKRARQQLNVAREALDNDSYGLLHNELMLLRQLIYTAVGVTRDASERDRPTR